MSGTNVEFALAKFEQGYCWAGPQQFAEDFVAKLSGSIPGNFSGAILSANTPSVQDQDKLWAKLDASGRPIGIFIFNGQWLWPHPIAAGAAERKIYRGTEASVWSYDGGDATDPGSTAPTATTGAMWQVDHDFDFCFPAGAGTNATAYDGGSANSIAQGATGGEERHVLLQAELPAAQLGILSTAAGGYVVSDNSTGGTVTNGEAITSGGSATKKKALTDALGSGSSHQNMPPYLGVFFIKRTARQFYVGG